MIRGRALAPALLALGLLTTAQGALAQGAPPAPPAGSASTDAGEPADDAAKDSAPPEAKSKPVRATERAAHDPESEPEGAAPRPRKARAVEPLMVLPPAPGRDEATPAPAAPHKQHWSAGLGFVGSVVSSPGYDPYSKDNTLPMVALFGTYSPWDSRPFQLRLAFEYDYGGSSSTARAEPSSLEIHRLALGLEGRYTPISRIALFVRGMPSAMHIGASIKDPYLGNTLETGIWTWGVDLTGGAAARIGSIGNAEYPLLSFWVGLDMGYRFAGSAAMRFRPGDLTQDDQSRHFGEVPLPNLDLSGFISRLSVSMSF